MNTFAPRAATIERNTKETQITVAITAQRWQLRSLQRYLVQAPRRAVDAWLARGDVAEPLPGWFVLQDPTRYDARGGLLRDGAVLDARTLDQ